MESRFEDYGITGIDLNRSGETYTTCPKCSPSRKHKSNRCLSVNGEKGVWKCHQCGRYGSLKRGWSDDPAWQSKREYLTPDFVPEGKLPEEVLRDFLKRKVSAESLKDLDVSFHPQIYFGELKGFAAAVCFPFYRDGKLVNVKYRGKGKKFRLESGAQRIFYNMDGCRAAVEKMEHPWCIIVEGEMDALSLHTAGLKNVMSVPDGAPDVKAKNYTSKFDFLENCEEFLNSFEEIFIAVDRDEPGQVLEQELARRLGMARCKRVVWPDGCKDANEVLIKYGREYVQDFVLNNAMEFPVSGIFTVRMLQDRIEEYYDRGLPKGVLSGVSQLDRCWRPTPGHLVVLTGASWSGKSTFWDWYMMQFAKMYGWHSVIFSPENLPLEFHMAKMITRYANQPFEDGRTQRMDKLTMHQARDFVHEHFTWVLPSEEEDFSLDKILEKMDTVVARKGAKMAIVDPWNEIDHILGGMSETNYISKSLTSVRRFARSHGVEFTISAHPTKLPRDFRTGKRQHKPSLEDISGSIHFKNKADVGIVVSRKDTVTEIDVQKVRFEEHGQKGIVKLSYDLTTKNFSVLDVETELANSPNDGQVTVSRPTDETGF